MKPPKRSVSNQTVIEEDLRRHSRYYRENEQFSYAPEPVFDFDDDDDDDQDDDQDGDDNHSKPLSDITSDDETENDIQDEDDVLDDHIDQTSIYASSVPMNISSVRRTYIPPDPMALVTSQTRRITKKQTKNNDDDDDASLDDPSPIVNLRRPSRATLKRHGEDDIFQVPSSYIERYMSFRDDFFSNKDKDS
jgi:hypothetical protein